MDITLVNRYLCRKRKTRTEEGRKKQIGTYLVGGLGSPVLAALGFREVLHRKEGLKNCEMAGRLLKRCQRGLWECLEEEEGREGGEWVIRYLEQVGPATGLIGKFAQSNNRTIGNKPMTIGFAALNRLTIGCAVTE